MAFFKKEGYSNKEKKSYDYLNKILQIFQILSKLSSKKEKIVGKKYLKLLELIDYKGNGIVKRFWNRKSIARTLDELKQLSRELLDKIKKQERLLVKDIRINQKEEQIITEIQNIPLFKNISSRERKLIAELIYNQKQEIYNLLLTLKNFLVSLKSQKDYLEGVSHLFDERLLFAKDGYANKKIEEFKVHFIELIQWEHKAIEFSTRIVQRLIEESKRIIEENKIIETKFNPDDLNEIMQQITVDIRKEKSKAEYLRKYLFKQRHLRANLNINHLIAVHCTNFLPNDGVIKTSGQAKKRLNLLGVQIQVPRETIHMAFNGIVGDLQPFSFMTGSGSWKDKRYAILIPVNKIINRIINISPWDAFIFGELMLPKGSEIIVPEQSLFRSVGGDKEYYQKNAVT